MTYIRHNLNLSSRNARVTFEDADHNKLRGANFVVEDSNTIELDDTYLEQHPEIAFVVIEMADGSAKFGWSRYEVPEPPAPREFPAMYQHYKGGMYLLMRIGQHHERHDELWAIYRPVTGDESVIYVRPLSEFDATVRSPEEYSRWVPRFRLLTDAEGEQVALDRLKQQLDSARADAEGDPEGQTVVNITEHLLETLQERLNAALEQ